MQNENDVLWERYYIKKPLSLMEFVEKQTNLKHLYNCVQDALRKYEHIFYKDPYRVCEVFTSGAVGIGKGVYNYILIAYRLYTNLLLKNLKNRLLNLSPSTKVSCVFFGTHSDETLKGFINFLENIQDKENPIFVSAQDMSSNKMSYTRKDKIVFIKNNQKGFSIAFRDNVIELVSAKTKSDLLGICPLMVSFNCTGYDSDTAYTTYKDISTRMAARLGLISKGLFSSLLVEKDPDNLYSDIFDQYINEVDLSSLYLVERFCPIFQKNKEETDLNWFIDITNGNTGPISNRNNYIQSHPNAKTHAFPADNPLYYNMVFENPKRFINEILGLPAPNQYKVSYEVTDAVSALNTVKKLIADYNIQITTSKEGLYLSIPNLNFKLKV